tara:strand:+ start:59 stop:556 length:498 start_codon:yes stop_codon:yes gene_type:complete
MKILITGGVKSGKSINAEKRILEISKEVIPIYLATCEIFDPEMVRRISEHRERRRKKFKTIEESLYLFDVIKDKKSPVLIECMTMWLNNALQYNFTEKKIFSEIENLLKLKNDLIFVMNEVGMGVIPENNLARKFSDLSGRISQKLSESCDEVSLTVAGILIKLK